MMDGKIKVSTSLDGK